MFSRKAEPPFRPPRDVYEPGTYAGPAVFKPQRVDDLREDLRHAVGQVVELMFVTIAGPDERYAGQNIYMERPGLRSVLRGAWVADEDIQFVAPAHALKAEHDDRAHDVRPERTLLAAATDAPLVLFVDDSRDTRELYGYVLSMAGFQVIEAEDGVSAVEVARSAGPDAIVMDIDLPRLSGVEAIRLLRSEPRTSHTPILAFTAHGAASAAEAIRSGATTHCLKPCLPEAFIASLKSILPAVTEVERVRR